jgi:hypothetical protein
MVDVRVATASEAAPSSEIESSDGVAKYLASADQMRGIADVVLKVGSVLAVLLLIAWVLGLLPGAVRLF